MDIQQFFSRQLLVLLFVCGGVSASGQSPTPMNVVEDLSLRLYRLDSSELSFSANLDQEDVLGFYITRSDRFDLLSICNTDSFTIWRQGQMIQDLTVCYQVSSELISTKSDTDTVYFTILSSGYFEGLDIKLLAERVDGMQLQNIISLKHSSASKEWSILMLFVLGLFAVFIRNQNANLFSYLFRINARPARDMELEVELDLNLLLSICFVSLMSVVNIQFMHLLTSESSVVSTLSLLADTVRLTLLVALLLLLRFFLISVVSGLNMLAAVKGAQFMEFIKFFSIGGVLLWVTLQARYWLSYGYEFRSFWLSDNFYLIIYSLFILYFYIGLVQRSSLKKLHIISYLCTTELIGIFLLALIIYK